MKLLDLYFFANMYILFFWVFYRLFLQKSHLFQRNRIFILTSLFTVTCLPFLQSMLSSFLGSSEVIASSFQSLKINYISSGLAFMQNSSASRVFEFNWEQAMAVIILGGFIATSGYFVLNHIRINSLIKRSRLIGKSQTRVFLCEEEIIPFIYNDAILIPKSTSFSDYDIIIRHERQHFMFGHHYDNYLIQFFQMIFWLNPFFYLLKNKLREVHEFQVDKALVSNGIDVIQYKLALVKFRAGNQKFAIANGLNTNLKNRLIMMNSNQKPKGKWKILLSIPALSFLFFVFSFSCINPDVKDTVKDASALIQETDSIEIKLITLPEGIKINEPLEAIIVLINKVSDVAIEGKFAPAGKRVEMIITEYEKLREERFFNQQSPVVKIITQKDQNTNEEDYKALLDEISKALYTLHEKYSQNKYNRSFSQLSDEEQADILDFIPPVIYYAPPKKVSRK